MATLEEQNAILMRQVEYFASDERIEESVALWADATPEERLAEVAAMCRASSALTRQLTDDQLSRLRRVNELPADTIAILERLRRGA